MKHYFLLPAFALLLNWAVGAGSARAQSPATSSANLHLVPMPQSVTAREGTFALTPDTRFAAKGKGAKQVAAFFADKIGTATGHRPTVGSKQGEGAICLTIDKSIDGDEGYRLIVGPTGVEARARTARGLFYAMQTFMQLLPPQIESQEAVKGVAWTAPAVAIEDKPRFGYRGFHLDVCRHFLPVEAVKRQIDVMSLFKMNTLHFHLTEDQGWRIEIKKYPLLTQIGAWRTESDGERIGGYYTQEQIKEIVAYAAERHIDVIPELELPGHELAAIAAYPWLSCTGQKVAQPRRTWGVEDIVMCPGKESTFEFLENVVKEMVKLFPSKYFHIGGDECPRSMWKQCPLCQQRIKQLGIVGTKQQPAEAQLQSYVVRRMEKVLNRYGKTIIGWDEILEGGNLNPSAVVMSWRGVSGGIQAAKAGHKAIMTPSPQGMYLDHYQDSPEVTPAAIGGFAPLNKVYAYDPTPKEIVEAGLDRFILGAQCNVWSEYLYTPRLTEYRMYPRAVAVAEVDWTLPEHKDYDRFVRTLEADTYLRMALRGVNFHIPIPQQVGGSFDQVAFVQPVNVAFTTVRPERMVYTLDGTQPTASSTPYTTPLHIDRNTTLRIATVLPCGIVGPARTISFEQQDYAEAVKTTNTPAQGLTLKISRKPYNRAAEIEQLGQWTETKTILDLDEIRKQQQDGASYGAVAEGYLNIPADGVYRFSTKSSQLWIDGKKLVDNDAEPCLGRHTNDGSCALRKGLHAIRVFYVDTERGGLPSRDTWAGVSMQRIDGNEKLNAVSNQLYYH